MTKDFKFSVKTKSGKVLHESIVTFGGEKHPFPENWKDDYWVQIGILNTKEKIFKDNFDIEISEDLTFTIEDNQIEKDKLKFAIEQLKNLKSKISIKDGFRDYLKQIQELEQKLSEL